MNKVKIKIKESKKYLVEGSMLSADEMQAFMDVVTDPGRQDVLINPESGDWSLTKAETPGKNITFGKNGRVDVNANLGRNFINFEVDGPRGFEKNPDVKAFFDQGKEISDMVRHETNTWYARITRQEIRDAIGDIRTRGQMMWDEIKLMFPFRERWRKVKHFFSLENRLYKKSLGYLSTDPEFGEEPIDRAGRRPKDSEQWVQALEDNPELKKDLKANEKIMAKNRSKLDRAQAQALSLDLELPENAKLKQKIEKLKNIDIAGQHLQDVMEMAVRKGIKKPKTFLRMIGGVIKKVAKKTSPFGTGIGIGVAAQLYQDCKLYGASDKEATAVTSMDEVDVTGLAAEAAIDWLHQRFELASTRYVLSRGRVGADTQLGVYTKEDESVVRRADKNLLKRKTKELPAVNSPNPPLQENRIFQRTNKIKIKINS